MKKTIEDEIDKLLTFAALSDLDEEWARFEETVGDRAQAKWLTLPLAYFNRARAWTPKALEYFRGEDILPVTSELPFSEILDAVNRTWDLRVVREAIRVKGGWQSSELFDGIGPPMYMFERFRSVPFRELRGFGLRLSSGIVGENSLCVVDNRGKYRTHRILIERHSGGWHTLGQPWAIPREDIAEGPEFDIKISATLSGSYDWRVAMGIKDRPKISIPTTPVGARALFRDRELETGRDRRQALRHWVRAHFRKVPSTGVPYQVWPHMRGVVRFGWRGVDCEVLPSAYDLKRLKAYQRNSERDKKDRARVRRATKGVSKDAR